MTTYASAADFLAGLLAEEEDVILPGGVVVRIRPLTAIETSRLYEKTKESGELALRAVALAMVEPKLNEEQVQAMFRGAAGRLAPLIQRVMALSGMSNTEESENLPGGGS